MKHVSWSDRGMRSVMYSWDIPWRLLKACSSTLYLMRWRIGSQCKPYGPGPTAPGPYGPGLLIIWNIFLSQTLQDYLKCTLLQEHVYHAPGAVCLIWSSSIVNLEYSSLFKRSTRGWKRFKSIFKSGFLAKTVSQSKQNVVCAKYINSTITWTAR